MPNPNSAPVRQFPVIREYMTWAPYTIGRDASLSTAQQLMRTHVIRHLPVLEAGQIVGIISQRDLLLVETLPGVDPTEVRVEEAMVGDVFTVGPDAPVGEVVEEMISRKLGSAIACDGGRVVGVFTTVDALRALHEQLERH